MIHMLYNLPITRHIFAISSSSKTLYIGNLPPSKESANFAVQLEHGKLNLLIFLISFPSCCWQISFSLLVFSPKYFSW